MDLKIFLHTGQRHGMMSVRDPPWTSSSSCKFNVSNDLSVSFVFITLLYRSLRTKLRKNSYDEILNG